MKNSVQFIKALIAIVLLTTSTAYSANELFRSAATGNWSSNSTWEMSTNGGSIWFPATSTPRDTSGTITLRNPYSVTVTVNTTANQLTIDSGGVLSINNGIILTITAGSGNEITVSKGGILNGPGTVMTEGISEFNLRGGSAFNANLKVNTGTTYAYDQTSPYDGSLYGNVTIDAGATLNTGNVSGRHLFMYGNVTNNGTITASSTGGSYSINGPSLVNNGVITTAGIVYFDSTTNISGNGSFTPSSTSASGKITLLSNITYSPGSTIYFQTGSILNPNGNTFTLTSGTLGVNPGATVSAPGTVRTQNTVSLNLRAGSAFNADLNINTGTTYAYDQTSPFDGSLYGNVTIDAGATLNTGNVSGRHLFMYGNVTNNGTITASSTGGSYSINGPSLVNNGVITTAGTAYFDSTTNISGNGSFTPSATSASGKITLLNNITYSPGAFIYFQTGSILKPNGNTFTLTSGTLGVNPGATVSTPGTVKTQNTVALDLRGGSSFNADLNVNTGTTYAYNQASPYDGSLFGNVTIDAGATLNGGNISGRAIFFFGNIVNNGILTASSTGGSIRIKGPSLINNGLINHAGLFFFDAATSLSGSGSFTSNANFASGSNVTLNSLHQMNSITISSGAAFNISNQRLKLNASNPISQSGTFTATNSTVEYNGTSAQTVSTVNITYSKLRINNSAGTSLANNVTVNDSLIIQLGTLDLSGRILTVSPTGFLSETPGNVVKGSTGYLTTTRNINSPSSLNVGGFGAVLTSSSNLGSTEVRRGHSARTGGGIMRYYDITPANNSGLNATLVFKYDDSELNGRPENSLKLFKSTNSGTNWTNMGGTVNGTLNEITLPGLSSFSRWTADSSGVSAVIKFAIEGFYNASTNRLRMRDTVRIYLRQNTSPYALVDSSISLLDSVQLAAPCVFSNAPTGTYYIQIRHRNSIETWSKTGGEPYIAGNTLNYDFLPDAASAYGSNEIQVDASPLRFAIYSGDVTQEGSVDAADISLVDNDVSNFVTGYVTTDVTGNNVVDAADLSVVDNNAFNFASRVRP